MDVQLARKSEDTQEIQRITVVSEQAGASESTSSASDGKNGPPLIALPSETQNSLLFVVGIVVISDIISLSLAIYPEVFDEI